MKVNVTPDQKKQNKGGNLETTEFQHPPLTQPQQKKKKTQKHCYQQP